jgi:ribosomal protein S18 acetylase RimI-like enzyme
MAGQPRGMEFWLRPAKPRDYLLAASLYLDGAESYLSKIGRWNGLRSKSRFRRGYKQAQTQVICVGDQPIGWMQVAEFVGRLHLHQLHLSAEFRGRGIGTRLLEDLLQRADSIGKPVTLEVMHGNRARRLYLRLGFKPTGRDPDKIQMIRRPARRAEAAQERFAQKANAVASLFGGRG